MRATFLLLDPLPGRLVVLAVAWAQAYVQVRARESESQKPGGAWWRRHRVAWDGVGDRGAGRCRSGPVGLKRAGGLVGGLWGRPCAVVGASKTWRGVEFVGARSGGWEGV